MKKRASNTKFISHILILLLCVFMAVAATFSWYNRTVKTEETGGLLKYSQSGKITGKGCSIATYAGTDTKGTITYSDTDISSTSSTLTAEPGKPHYFKTVITDSSNADSMLSVYLESISYSTSLSGKVYIGLTQPEKTYKSVSGSQVCVEDNIEIKANGTAEIEWFVVIDSSTTTSGDISLGTMHVVYN